MLARQLHRLLVRSQTRLNAMRSLHTRWTDADIETLKKLHAAGASALRASLALKKNKNVVRALARKLGIPFVTERDRKRRQAERERSILAAQPKR